MLKSLKVVLLQFFISTGISRSKKPNFSFLNRELFDLRKKYLLNLKTGDLSSEKNVSCGKGQLISKAMLTSPKKPTDEFVNVQVEIFL